MTTANRSGPYSFSSSGATTGYADALTVGNRHKFCIVLRAYQEQTVERGHADSRPGAPGRAHDFHWSVRRLTERLEIAASNGKLTAPEVARPRRRCARS